MAALRPLARGDCLNGDLEALLESGEAADITLEVFGSRLLAHRAILAARSPVFRAKLRDVPRETGNHTLWIPNMEEEVLKQMLFFMYTDQVPHIRTYAVKLLLAAVNHDMPLLKDLCEDTLAQEITTQNVSLMAVLAVEHKCTKLKEASINYIRSHNEVLATSGWEEAIISQPRIVAEICRLMVAKPSELSTNQPPVLDLQQCRGHLVDDMAALLESGEDADMMLRTGRQGFQLAAHRAILVARCPALAAQPCLKGVRPTVLAQVLLFLYTGQLPVQSDSAGDLLVAASRFSLPSLVEWCEHLLMEGLTVETAAAAAVLSVTHHRLALRNAAVDFIWRHTPQVMGTDGWKVAMREHTEVAVEICSLISAAAAATTTTTTIAAAVVAFAAAAGGGGNRGNVGAASAVPHVSNISPEEMNKRLLQAAKDGALKELKALLTSNADVGARDGYKMTALHWAAERGNLKSVKCLLSHGADIDPRDRWRRTPLHRAAWCGRQRVVSYLLQAGADPEAKDERGRTPTCMAKLRESSKRKKLQ